MKFTKKSQNVVREALSPVFATVVAIAVVGTGVYLGTSSNTEANLTDLSEYVSPNWDEAEKIDQSQFISLDELEEMAFELDIEVDEITMFVLNSNEQIVGTNAFATSRDEVPDLIAVALLCGQNGTIFGHTPEGWLSGFVLATDFYCDETTAAYYNTSSSLEQTTELTEKIAQKGTKSIPVYDIEGEIILGMLDVEYNIWPNSNENQ
jgi:flagellin-like protein